jgi:uncharacterized protein (TIGR03067 family)
MSTTRSRGALASLLALGAFAAALGLLAWPGLSAQEKGSKDPLDGVWSAVALTVGGKTYSEEQVRMLQFDFRADKVTVSKLDQKKEGTFKVDASKSPRQFDMHLAGEKASRGIYKLEKDRLTLCFADGDRPERFESAPGSRNVLAVLKRGAFKVDVAELKRKAELAQLGALKDVSQNNLKQLALAMHNYHDTYNGLPRQAILSKDGKPLLSWRVAILPFIEENNLYQDFKLDEPWDSPANKKLLARMPKIYEPLVGKPKVPHSTYYQVFTGPMTMFEMDPKRIMDKKLIRLTDVLDGTSNTIMIVEAGEPVPWTKPEDLTFDPKAKELPKVGGQFPDGFFVAVGDGSTRWVVRGFDPRILRAAITRNGGEVVNLDQLSRPKE